MSWQATIRACFNGTPSLADYAVAVGERLNGAEAALHALQFVCAGLTRERVHEFATVPSAGRPTVAELVTDKDRQVARVSPEALAYYPDLLWAMWEELPVLDGYENGAARSLLVAAMEAFSRAEAA